MPYKRPSAWSESVPGSIPISPISSPSLDPPPGSNGLGRWMAWHLGAVLMRLDQLEGRDTEMIEWQRQQDRTAIHHGERLAVAESRIDRIEESKTAPPAPARVGWKDRLEAVKAISTALMWIAGPLIILAHQMGWIDGQTAAAVKAALGAAGGGSISPGEHGP